MVMETKFPLAFTDKLKIKKTSFIWIKNLDIDMSAKPNEGVKCDRCLRVF